MLLQGEGAAQDHAESRRWAELAAKAGVATAMTRMGMFFHDALGVERDVAAAAVWWQRAAEAGEAEAQAMLGAAFHMGRGVAKDDIKALYWLLRADRAGEEKAKAFLGRVRAVLSPAQIAEAEFMAREAGAPGR